MKKIINSMMILFAVSSIAQSQTQLNTQTKQELKNIYAKAGTIKIIDKKAVAAGTMDKILNISLEDIGVFDGHICACNTAGFIITKNVFAKLFPGQTPMRNSMNIKISSYTQDIVDAIEFITGNRLDGEKYTNTKSDLIIDPALQGKEGTVTFLFERKDNGKKLKVVLNRMVLLTQKEAYAFMQIKPKMANKTATKEEKQELRNATIAVVKKEILNMPKGAVSYEIL